MLRASLSLSDKVGALSARWERFYEGGAMLVLLFSIKRA